jgi:hypothetical protein
MIIRVNYEVEEIKPDFSNLKKNDKIIREGLKVRHVHEIRKEDKSILCDVGGDEVMLKFECTDDESNEGYISLESYAKVINMEIDRSDNERK